MGNNAAVGHRLVTLLATSLALSAPTVARAAVVPAHACQTAIEVSFTVELKWSPEDIGNFRREAERVWTALGVDLCWRDATSRCERAATTIHVRVAEYVPTAETTRRGTLGWIGFSDANGPGPFIVLSLRRAIELLGRVERAARRLADLPGMVERLLPRALGRALAHELGHYLLARRAHSPVGVMREAFRPEDLADEGEGQRLQLAPHDARTLVNRCGPRPVGMSADAAVSAQ